MQWYKAFLKEEEAQGIVLNFEPKNFQTVSKDIVKSYLSEKEKGTHFKMSEILKIQTGVTRVEEVSEDEKVEEKILHQIKEVQENAYREAYDLGVEEGRKEAFQKNSLKINSALSSVDELLKSLSQMKKELLLQNESHFIQMCFYLATRIAKKEISMNPSILIDLMREAVSLSQDEESVQVLVSNEQLKFVEDLQKSTHRDLEFLKNVKIIGVDDITEGGCIVKTNYGEIDSRIEQRVEQLWNALSEMIPKSKESVVIE